MHLFEAGKREKEKKKKRGRKKKSTFKNTPLKKLTGKVAKQAEREVMLLVHVSATLGFRMAKLATRDPCLHQLTASLLVLACGFVRAGSPSRGRDVTVNV